MTTRRRSMRGMALTGLIAALAIGQSACQPCNQKGMTISAEMKSTSIGGAKQFLRVGGSHFPPGVPITISFRNYPASNPSQQEFAETNAITTDSSGNFTWDKDIFSLPPRNFNADGQVEVFITAKETNGGCLALTSISTQKILHPPLVSSAPNSSGAIAHGRSSGKGSDSLRPSSAVASPAGRAMSLTVGCQA